MRFNGLNAVHKSLGPPCTAELSVKLPEAGPRSVQLASPGLGETAATRMLELWESLQTRARRLHRGPSKQQVCNFEHRPSTLCVRSSNQNNIPSQPSSLLVTNALRPASTVHHQPSCTRNHVTFVTKYPAVIYSTRRAIESRSTNSFNPNTRLPGIFVIPHASIGSNNGCG
ncbi:hypothetical protein VTI28DRAFT_507 [Corynascus sepedonium]